MKNSSYSELITISPSFTTGRPIPSSIHATTKEEAPKLQCEENKEKNNSIREHGKYGEFKGGLMDEDYGYDYQKRTMILTSKDDVRKFVKKRRSASRFDDGKNHACQQCIIQ